MENDPTEFIDARFAEPGLRLSYGRHVEDSPAGMAAAGAAGCVVLGVKAPDRPHLAEAVAVLPDLHAVARHLAVAGVVAAG